MFWKPASRRKGSCSHAACASCASHGRRRWVWPGIFIAVVAVALSVSLFVLPRPGLSKVEAVSSRARGQDQPALAPASPPAIAQQDLLGALVRYGARPEGASPAYFPAMDILLATPVYFNQTGRQAPPSPQNGPSIIFYVAEHMHIGELPESAPQPLLKVGDFYHRPAEVTMLTNSPHHRTTLLRYAFQAADGQPVVKAGDRSLELLFPTTTGETPSGSVLSWNLPIAYGDAYSSEEIAVGTRVDATSVAVPGPLSEHPVALAGIPYLGGAPLPLLAIPALLGAIFVALTPCLIDLVLYYAAFLGGAVAGAGASGVALNRRRLLRETLLFVLGFALVYTAGGALAGYVGKLLQPVGLAETWTRPLAIVGGAVIIFMAIRVAVEARPPGLCKLRVSKALAGAGDGRWGALAKGSSYATRCLSCFSGTVLGALLLYAGTSGSPFLGALLLLIFSLGVGVVLSLASLLLTRFLPVLAGLKRLRPALGLASAFIMVGFGVAMILDKDHIVSGFVFHLLNLS